MGVSFKMRIKKLDNGFICWLSEVDTRDALRIWPCSTLKGRRVRFEIFKGSLVDLSVDGGSPSIYYDGYELGCLINEFSDKVKGMSKICIQ